MKTNLFNKSHFITILILLFAINSVASGTRVGNGDDGSDLEGFEEVKSGIIVDSRNKAVNLLRDLRVSSIAGLGYLEAEVANTKLYMTRRNIKDSELEDLGAYHKNSKDFIYARTFPRPHSATRFFPVSNSLSEDQLVALHIHEGLHRALPKELREKEDVVSLLTRAIVSPNATNDSVYQISESYVVRKKQMASGELEYFIPPEAKVNQNANFDYKLTTYSGKKKFTVGENIQLVHSINSKLYPFGGKYSSVGIGIGASFINQENQNVFGPLQLSGDMRLWTFRGFDVDGTLEMAISSAAEDEFSASELGRDVAKIGLVVSKKGDVFELENELKYTLPSSSTEQIGNQTINYHYGDIISAKIKMNSHWRSMNLGGFLQYSIAKERKIESSQTIIEGRERILQAGPQLSWKNKNLEVGIRASYLLNANDDFSLDRFGDILGTGIGRDHYSMNVNLIW